VKKLWKTITWENCGKFVKRIAWKKILGEKCENMWKAITWENCGKTMKKIVWKRISWEKCGKQ
jgi:hypothetical protein